MKTKVKLAKFDGKVGEGVRLGFLLGVLSGMLKLLGERQARVLSARYGRHLPTAVTKKHFDDGWRRIEIEYQVILPKKGKKK